MSRLRYRIGMLLLGPLFRIQRGLAWIEVRIMVWIAGGKK
jgi:hypothetical protein